MHICISTYKYTIRFSQITRLTSIITRKLKGVWISESWRRVSFLETCTFLFFLFPGPDLYIQVICSPQAKHWLVSTLLASNLSTVTLPYECFPSSIEHRWRQFTSLEIANMHTSKALSREKKTSFSFYLLLRNSSDSPIYSVYHLSPYYILQFSEPHFKAFFPLTVQ